MPEEPSETKYSIEFDDLGRMVVRNLELAERLLESATQDKGVEIVINLPPLPDLSPGCGITPPPDPNSGVECVNICPFSGTLRYSQPALDEGLAEQWEDFVPGGESGPASPR